MHARFAEMWGYELSPHLPALFRRVGEWRRARHHYHRTLLELFIDAYFAQVSEWCASHGVMPQHLTVGRRSLEDVFLALTGEQATTTEVVS